MRASGAAAGRTHDLGPIFLALNRAYFDGAIAADITWGRPGKKHGRSRRSITLGSFDERARRITIHPVLDEPSVPELCVARVVHHEMVHAKIPPEREGGRRLVHGPRFRALEAKFVGATEADDWLDAHLDALLRYDGRGAKRKP